MEFSFSVPTVVLNHVGQFNDVLPLLVLLTEFEGLFLQENKRKEMKKMHGGF